MLQSGLKQEDRRLAVDARQTVTTPSGSSACHDALAGQCEIGRDADFGIRSAGIDHCFKQLLVAVGRFNENLRPFFLPGIIFQFP
jgi:hypothetical protein